MGLQSFSPHNLTDTLTTGTVGAVAVGGTPDLVSSLSAMTATATHLVTTIGQLIIILATLYSLLRKNKVVALAVPPAVELPIPPVE